MKFTKLPLKLLFWVYIFTIPLTFPTKALRNMLKNATIRFALSQEMRVLHGVMCVFEQMVTYGTHLPVRLTFWAHIFTIPLTFPTSTTR